MVIVFVLNLFYDESVIKKIILLLMFQCVHVKTIINCRSEGAGEGKSGTFFSKLKPHFDRPELSISPSKFFKKKT